MRTSRGTRRILRGRVRAGVLVARGAGARRDVQAQHRKPFTLSGFQTILPKITVPTPKRSGYITRMDAWLVYEDGRRVSIRDVMLHHIVFINVGRDKNGSCPGRGGEPFWGTGEEKQPLILPEGYGYRIRKNDRWRMQTMLMSHSLRAHKVRVVYSVRMITGARLTRVKPLWLRANGCSTHPSYDIEGDLPPGSKHVKQSLWRMPLSGRIVAASGHLHGSSYGLTVKQPRCHGPHAHRPEAALRLPERHRLPRQADPPRARAGRDRDVPVEDRHPGPQGRDAAA